MTDTLLDGAIVNNLLDAALAPYAQKHGVSLGRVHPESVDPLRSPFQRDRDRIIHTTAFRRLKGKMQVVSPRHGDHFRNRLTHTIEVTQIARDLARQLKLNEDLAETIALAHDLGHPPFGHAGETALNDKMKAIGRHFEHNEQSLRIVEHFEPRYQKFDGLNLTLEVRLGMQKHASEFDHPNQKTLGKIFSPHLESQLVDIADAVAYLSADLEDGLRGGFFTLADLESLVLVKTALIAVPKDEHNFRPSVIRGVMRLLIRNLAESSAENLQRLEITSLADVQTTSEKIIVFEPGFYRQFKAVKAFLMERFYSAPMVKNMSAHGREAVAGIFDYLEQNPEKITHYDPKEDLYVQICDFIAGMTDSFAEELYEQISGDK